MDEFINKVKEGASKTMDEAEKITKTVVNKTKSVIDQTKYKYTISGIDAKVNEILAELGKKIYDEYCEGAEFDDEINEKCEKIKAFRKEIDDINSKIAQMKNTVICTECNQQVPADSIFCPKCGRRLK